MKEYKPLSNLEGYRVMLASRSPRRRELMSMLGIKYELAPLIDVEENYPDTMPAGDVAPYLSLKKAQAYSGCISPSDLIITADTIVVVDNTILGKPADGTDAGRMLHRLSGRTHTVITGVTLLGQEIQHTFASATEVDFAPLTDDEITYYVETYRPLDKAGAYGVQEWIGAVGITGLRGSYYNVMGLPVQRLFKALGEIRPLA